MAVEPIIKRLSLATNVPAFFLEQIFDGRRDATVTAADALDEQLGGGRAVWLNPEHLPQRRRLLTRWALNQYNPQGERAKTHGHNDQDGCAQLGPEGC